VELVGYDVASSRPMPPIATNGAKMPSDLPPFRVSFERQRFIDLPITPVQNSIMPVVVIREGSLECIGTAFSVANFGAMLTAKHVITEAKECSENDRSLVAVLYVAEGIGHDVPDLLGGPLPITHACLSGATDLAVLQVQLPVLHGTPLHFPALRLSPGIPAVGTSIMTLGYNRFEVRGVSRSADRPAFELASHFSASAGKILQGYPRGRDSVVAPFPCFEVGGRFDAGMSGGPVISVSTGAVCGMVLTGFDKGEDTNDDTSFASLLAPAFDLSIVVIDESGREEALSVLELARRGFVPTDDSLTRVEFVDMGDGTRQLRYS
jgi:trypsin-like peptidase